MPRQGTFAFFFGKRTKHADGPPISTYDIAELEDCSIAVDASYYLSVLLDTDPSHEPLLPALGGLTGIQIHIRQNLDLWDKNRIVPFFIFDGQSIIGQDEITLKRGRAANQKTDEAWDLYSQTEAEQAVAAFGANPGMAPSPEVFLVLCYTRGRLTNWATKRCLSSSESIPSFPKHLERKRTALFGASLQRLCSGSLPIQSPVPAPFTTKSNAREACLL